MPETSDQLRDRFDDNFDDDLDYLLTGVSKSSSIIEPKITPQAPTTEKPVKSKNKKSVKKMVSVAEIQKDISEINFSSDDESLKFEVEQKLSQLKKDMKKNKDRNVDKQKKSAKLETKSNEVPATENKTREKKPKAGNNKPVIEQLTDEPQNIENSVAPKKSKKRKSRKKKTGSKEPEDSVINSVSPEPEEIVGKPVPEKTEKAEKSSEKIKKLETDRPALNTSREVTPELEDSPFNVKLKARKSTHSNKKYGERVPKIPPIETIGGLSNEQIFKLGSNDIKLKLITNQADKSLKNILQFVTKAKDLFEDPHKKEMFIEFCISIALYESSGFNKSLKKYPEIPQVFGDFEELMLTFTNTPVTKSDKTVHKNDFDYSIIANIGHILIWADSIHKFGFVDKELVKAKVGGYYLWDQLFKEHTINMKRWKHIIKFRELFVFQPNQFIVILRYLNISI